MRQGREGAPSRIPGKDIHNSRLELCFEKKIPGLRVSEAVRHQEFVMRQRHVHDTIELFFLIEGKRFIFVEQETYSLQAGCGMLIPHNMIHKTSMADGCKPYHRNFILQLDRSIFDGLLCQLGYPGFDEFGRLYGGITAFNETEWQLILQTIEQFKQACRRGAEEEQELYAYLRLLAMNLLGSFAFSRKLSMAGSYKGDRGLGIVTTGVHKKVHDIAMYLQSHSAESLSLEALAAEFYMSKSYLTRIFRKVTGYSVVEYLNFIKIRKAQSLLKESSLSITEIAGITGFGNITYFEKVFKGSTGKSPAQYRKNAGEG